MKLGLLLFHRCCEKLAVHWFSEVFCFVSTSVLKSRYHFVVFNLLFFCVSQLTNAQSPLDEYSRYAMIELGIEKYLLKEDHYSKNGVQQIKIYESTIDTSKSLELNYHRRTFSLDSLGRFNRLSHEVGSLNGNAPESIDSIYYDASNRIARVVLYHKHLKGKYSSSKYSYVEDTLDRTFHYEMEKLYHKVNEVVTHELTISLNDKSREILECLNDRLVNRSYFVYHSDTTFLEEEHWDEDDDSIYLKYLTESVYDSNDRLKYNTYFDCNPVSKGHIPTGEITQYEYDSLGRQVLISENRSNGIKIYQTVYNDDLKTISLSKLE